MNGVDEFTIIPVRVAPPGCNSPTAFPVAAIVAALHCPEEHLLVVPFQENELTAARKVNELLDDLVCFRTVVDHVAQDNDRVVGLRIYGLDKGAQGRRAAVDVSDRDESLDDRFSCHGSNLISSSNSDLNSQSRSQSRKQNSISSLIH